MTTLTLPGRSGYEASPRPVPWRRMAWVTWRQHRFALAGVTALLGVLAVYVYLTGLQVHQAYAAVTGCHPASSLACQNVTDDFNSTYSSTAEAFAGLLQAVPALIGAFVGAPVLARELETGTFRYTWTQGFGRRRWALAKLLPLAVVVTAAAWLFSLLFSWYFQPFLLEGNQTPLAPAIFGLRGIAFAAWTLAAFAIGTLAGMLIRRVVPAIGTTLAIYALAALAAGVYLRRHYLAPLRTTVMDVPGSAWIMSQQWETTKGGRPVSLSLIYQILQEAHVQSAGKGGGLPQSSSMDQFLTQHGYTHWTTYQPGSRFWTFQWIEGSWLLLSSVLLIAAAIWLVRHRAA